MEVSKPPPVGIRGEEDIPPQALGPASGRSAVLGRMPWDSRATALGPDIKEIGATRGRFNGGLKNLAEPVGGLLAMTARSGYTVRTTSTITSTLGARHGER